jgi:hypothetical protein
MKITSLRVKVHRSKERYNNDEGELTIELEPGDDFEVEEPKLRVKLDALISAHWKEKKEAAIAEMERLRQENIAKRTQQIALRNSRAVTDEGTCEGCDFTGTVGCEGCPRLGEDPGDGIPF